MTTARRIAAAKATTSGRQVLVAISPSDRLAYVALVLAGVAAAAGLLVAGLYRDTAEMARQARAADLVTIAVAVPTLAVALWRARQGSVGARLVAIGTLGYLSYSYAIFAFSVVIDPLTPVHIAILGFATWAFVLACFELDQATIDWAGQMRLSRRVAGTFLIVVVVLFAMLWLGQIAGAITSGRLPASISDLGLPTNAVYALDLAFALPLLAIAGWWLLRNDREGPAAALSALAFTVLMGLSVLAIFAIDAASGIAVDVAPVAIFGVITGVAAVLVVRSFRLGGTGKAR